MGAGRAEQGEELVDGGETTIAAVIAMITRPIANSATTARRSAATLVLWSEASRRASTRRRLSRAIASMAMTTTILAARYWPWSTSRRLVGLPTRRTVCIRPVATRIATLMAATREKRRTEGTRTSRDVVGMTIQPMMARPAIQAAAAAWCATSVRTPRVGQRIDRE